MSLPAADWAPFSFVWKAMYRTKATTTTHRSTSNEYMRLADYFSVILVIHLILRDELCYKLRYLGFFLGVEGASIDSVSSAGYDFQFGEFFDIKIIIKISIISILK